MKIMDENEKIEPPMVATIPIPPLTEGPRKGGINPPPENFVRPDPPSAFEPTTDAQADTIMRAAAYRAEAEATYKAIVEERQRMHVTLTEAMLTLESRKRQIASLELELAEARNNLQVVQSQCEDLRQSCSDIRAFQSEQMAQLKHLVARHENFEIPLPIRARIKRNGNGDHKKTGK